LRTLSPAFLAFLAFFFLKIIDGLLRSNELELLLLSSSLDIAINKLALVIEAVEAVVNESVEAAVTSAKLEHESSELNASES
jgi:hypothetical protein